MELFFSQMKFLIIVFPILIIVISPAISKIIGIAELIRHGARTPSYYEKQTENLFYHTSKYQLTVQGFQQHEILGAFLAKKYNEFFADSNRLSISISTSPRQRTIFSAIGHSKGLFPDFKLHYKNENSQLELREDDVPPGIGLERVVNLKYLNIDITDPFMDYIYHPHNCVYYGFSIYKKNKRFLSNDSEIHMKTVKEMLPIRILFQLKQFEIEEAIKKIQTALKETFDGLVEQWDFDTKTYDEHNLKNLIGTLIPIRYHIIGNKREKLFFNNEIETIIKKATINKFYKDKLNNTKWVILLASGFFEDLLTKFDNVLNKSTGKSFSLYSGHDSNLVSILVNLLDHNKIEKRLINSLNSSNDDWSFFIPPFASNILFELSSENKDIFIKIIYNGKEIDQDFIDGLVYVNGKGIHYETFKKVITEKRIIKLNKSDWECKIVKPKPEELV